ncbi:unnamed protein product [Sphagnum troendelagicum]|uniref:Uncharacterized protein n=1 Tax=Sphagnum troendelagicum TaxID=128251 RepID=A0ABP0TAI6_9BRYO
MGSSSNKAEDENHINNGVESDADVVVVYLADAGRIAVAHKCKRASRSCAKRIVMKPILLVLRTKNQRIKIVQNDARNGQ